MSPMDGLWGFLDKRIALARRYELIRGVQVEADKLIEELCRRRDGSPGHTLQLPMLRSALDAIAPVQPTAEEVGRPSREQETSI